MGDLHERDDPTSAENQPIVSKKKSTKLSYDDMTGCRSVRSQDGRSKAYHEFRGVGAPPEDIGDVGDIYFDLTPESYAVYGRYPKLWIKWEQVVGKDGPFSNRGLLSHPFLTDKYLWINKSGGVWFSKSTIAKEMRKLPNRLFPRPAKKFISEFLKHDQQQSKVFTNTKRCRPDNNGDEGGVSKRPRTQAESTSQSAAKMLSSKVGHIVDSV